MGKRFLIDSNIPIEYTGKMLPEKAKLFVSKVIDEEFNISIINKIEVLGHTIDNTDIEEFISLANVYNLDESTVAKTIQIRRVYKTKLPDSIIAATAFCNNLILITRNTKDFDKIDGIEVINPYDDQSA
jgi:predicted nucleic acid-binding protein